MKYDSIGANIRMFRMEKNLRQEDIAERAGLSTNYIGMIERGEKIPSLEKFIDICNALHVSADQILADVLDTGYNVKACPSLRRQPAPDLRCSLSRRL